LEIVQLKRKLRNLQQLFDHAPIGRFAITPEGCITSLNFAGASMLGLKREQAISRSFADYLMEDDRAVFDEFIKMILKLGEALPCELCICSGEGEPVFVILTAHKFSDEPAVHLIATDHTKLHHAHGELKRGMEDMDVKIQKRTGMLRSLARELTLAEERERQRIAGLVHDSLQQLLVAVLLNIGATKAKTKSRLLQTELENIEQMTKECVGITRSLAAELSPSILHQCGLAAGFGWLREWFGQKYGFDLEVSADESLVLDEEISITLFQCVREIAFNAVKHSSVKSARLVMACDGDSFVNISISDQGAGFDADDLILRDSWKGGFGLFSVRERVELLGGAMSIESAPGQGACFTLRFPLEALKCSNHEDGCENPSHGQGASDQVSDEIAAEGPPVRIVRVAESGAPCFRVVLADDHSVLRQGLVRVFLDEPDFEVVGEASNGKEAVELARELRPDIIVMDLQMPVMSGLEATRVIRRQLPGVQVIGLSMETNKESRRALLRAGALDLLHKGDSAEDLIERVRVHLAEKAMMSGS
jgi:PAS domain S-box-containing protein